MKRLVIMLAGLLASFLLPALAAGETIKAITENWTDALGGRDKLEQIDVLHTTSQVTIFGMEGTLHEWSAADGRHHLDLDLAGIFKIVMVSEDGAGWMRDQNGKISALAGHDLKDEMTAAYMASMSHLVPGRMVGSVKYAGTEDVTGYHIVKVTPEGGHEVTIYIHNETFLPVRSEQPQHDRTLTAVFSDWKEFGGVMYPTHVLNTTGDAQHDQLFVLTEVDANVALAAGVFDKPVDKAQDSSFAKGNSKTSIPIELENVHIFVQTRVNGSEPLSFVFDTGASVTVINTPTAEALGLELVGEIEARGAGEGSQKASFIQDVTFELPGVKLEGQTAVAIPFGMLEPVIGRPLDGVFGYDMISRFVIEIDYENELLNLYDRESFEYTGSGTRVPMQIDGSTPFITAAATMMDGSRIEGEFLIDTGAGSGVSFAAPFTEANKLLDALPEKIFVPVGMGVGGETKAFVGRIKTLDIGGLKFVNPLAGFSQDTAGAGANPHRAGLIGGEILSRCTVIFDYERGEMILEPNNSFEDPYNFGMSGLWLQTGGRDDWDTVSVRKVLPDSPAADAGLEAGDVIKSVDGRPVTDYTIAELYEYLKREGQTVRVTLARNGETMEKSIRLKKAI